jgi:hypothetical protein
MSIGLCGRVVLAVTFGDALLLCGDGVREEAWLWLVASKRWMRSCSHHTIVFINRASLEASHGIE